MPRPAKRIKDQTLLNAALQGLEIQKQRIEEQIQQVQKMLGGRKAKAAEPKKAAKAGGRKPLSAAARRRISLAQKRRWAAYRKGAGPAAK
ncbi:MAG: hypothetical protein AAB225_19415 [Acidobacteriota bacterium]